MHNIPPLAWAAILVIVVITVLVNLGMVLLLRNPAQWRNMKMPHDQRQPIDMQKAVDTLRDPFREERNQLGELSSLVSQLEKPSKNSDSMQNRTTEPSKYRENDPD